MVEALLAVIDRLVKLVSYHDARLHQRFTDLFDPVFQELLTVHGDYLGIYESIVVILNKIPAEQYNHVGHSLGVWHRKSLHEAVECVRGKRKAFAPVRIKLRALINEMRNMTLSPVEQRFVLALVAYFPTGIPQQEHPTEGTMLLGKLEDYLHYYQELEGKEDLDDADVRPIDIFADVQSLLTDQRMKWSIVCEAYAPLRIAAANWTTH
jgi:hypothetical protein